MLIIGAIIGNGDRHAGNFGWMRDADTGAYVEWRHYMISTMRLTATFESDRLLTDAVKYCMPYRDEVIRIAQIARESDNLVFQSVQGVCWIYCNLKNIEYVVLNRRYIEPDRIMSGFIMS